MKIALYTLFGIVSSPAQSRAASRPGDKQGDRSPKLVRGGGLRSMRRETPQAAPEAAKQDKRRRLQGAPACGAPEN